MRPEKLKSLLDNNLIQSDQYERLHSILTGKVISVYYELRIILYLGVMLFSTGVGFLIYKNIGEIGHMVVIAAMSLLCVVCIGYGFRFAKPYDDVVVKAPTPYFDYVVLLGCLLFVSVATYLQIEYSLFDDGMGSLTLITATLFFYFAYRFDHLGVLSLAIVALASFFSISISPQKWYSEGFFETANLQITSMIFGAALAALSLWLNYKGIKKHFTFTYMNFAALTFLTGATAGLFTYSRYQDLYLLPLLAGCAACAWYASRNRSFLFLLYAFVFAYIGITDFIADNIISDDIVFFLYMILSCGGFIYFIIRYRHYFKRKDEA